MQEYAQKPEKSSSENNSRSSGQPPISEILQAYKNATLQRLSVDEEKLFQAKTRDKSSERETLQQYLEYTHRDKSRYNSFIQGMFDTPQRKGVGNEEPLQGKFDSSSAASESPVQREVKPNNTGLPDNLKSGIENLSGYSLDDVKVHYNSDKPAQLSALAYAQGTDIHVAPGQERHLPHEAWHVVQQKQGRVQPTMQMQGVCVNDNQGLEKEADVMGETGVQLKSIVNNRGIYSAVNMMKNFVIQRFAVPEILGDIIKDTNEVTNDIKIKSTPQIKADGKVPGSDHWAKGVYDAFKRKLNEWEAVKFLLTRHSPYPQFGKDDTKEPDVYEGSKSKMTTVVENKYVTGEWAQVVPNIKKAIDQLLTSPRSKKYKGQLYARVEVSEHMLKEAGNDIKIEKLREYALDQVNNWKIGKNTELILAFVQPTPASPSSASSSSSPPSPSSSLLIYSILSTNEIEAAKAAKAAEEAAAAAKKAAKTGEMTAKEKETLTKTIIKAAKEAVAKEAVAKEAVVKEAVAKKAVAKKAVAKEEEEEAKEEEEEVEEEKEDRLFDGEEEEEEEGTMQKEEEEEEEGTMQKE